MATETFTITLDNQISGPAEKGASSVDRLKAAATAAAREADKAGSALGTLGSGANVDKAVSSVDRLKEAASSAAREIAKANKASDMMKPPDGGSNLFKPSGAQANVGIGAALSDTMKDVLGGTSSGGLITKLLGGNTLGPLGSNLVPPKVFQAPTTAEEGKAVDQKAIAGVVGGLRSGIDSFSNFLSNRYGKETGDFVGKALHEKLRQGTEGLIQDAPGKALEMLGSGAMMAVNGMMSLASAAANAAVSFVKYALNLRETRETTNQQMVGIDSGTMMRAKDISATTGQNTDEVARTMAKLQRKGFDAKGSGDMIQAMSDMKLMTGESGAGDQFAQAIAGIGDKNSGGVDQIKELFGKKSKGAAAFQANLAGLVGATGSDDQVKAQIDAAIKSGKISNEQATGAALNALTKQTGKDVGGLTKDYSETTVVGAKAALQNKLEDITNMSNQNDEAPKALVKLKENLKMGDDLSYLKEKNPSVDFGGVKGITGEDMQRRSDAGTGLPGFDVKTGGIPGVPGATMPPLETGGAAMTANTQGAALALPTKEDITGKFAEAGTWLSDVGGQITDGLWNGLTSAWGNMLGQFDALVAELPASVRQVLGIASPSKVMAELGGYTMEGFQGGIEAGAPAVDASLRNAVAPPSFENPSTGNTGGNAARGGGGLTIGDVTIEVHSSAADAKEVATETMAMWIRWLEDTGRQVGAVQLWVSRLLPRTQRHGMR